MKRKSNRKNSLGERNLFLKNLVSKNLIDWEKSRNFSQNLEYGEENKICASVSHQSRREKEFLLKNLEDWKEKENGFQNLKPRTEIDFFKILIIENRKRNENPIFTSERENME